MCSQLWFKVFLSYTKNLQAIRHSSQSFWTDFLQCFRGHFFNKVTHAHLKTGDHFISWNINVLRVREVMWIKIF